MRRFRVQFRSAVTLPPTLFLADYIINIAGFEFSTGTGGKGDNAELAAQPLLCTGTC